MHNDFIRLKGMRFFAYHGVDESERETGQMFEVDVELRGCLRIPGRSDRLTDTWDFNEIYRLVNETVTEERFNLIEALAEALCERLLNRFPAEEVRAAVRKPQLSLPGILSCAEVEVVREGGEYRKPEVV